jgi:hypothetical protein
MIAGRAGISQQIGRKHVLLQYLKKKAGRNVNYRGVSLLNERCKTYAKIITARLQKIIEAFLEDQPGFKKGDHMQIISSP